MRFALTWLRLCEWFVGGLFLFAGTVKIGDPGALAEAIGRYRLLPSAVSSLLGCYLPWVEIFTGAAIFWPRFRSGGLGMAWLLAAGFAAAQAQALLRGLDFSCGCFGAHFEAPLVWSLLRTLALAALSATLWWRLAAEPTP